MLYALLRHLHYVYNMKFIQVLSLVLILTLACRKEQTTPCHAQAIRELIMPVYMADSYYYAEHIRTNIRCAGKCPDGVPCDSMIELTNTSMGASVRRVRCGCGSQQMDHECGIIIEHIRSSPDTVETRLYCTHGSKCPVTSDTCMIQQQPLPSDTIRSRITDRDSLIIKQWVATCECMEHRN